MGTYFGVTEQQTQSLTGATSGENNSEKQNIEENINNNQGFTDDSESTDLSKCKV